MEVDIGDTEAHLVTYLQNILKCQIIPMNFMNLRDLVEEAPSKLKLYEYIQEKYPYEQFLDFLRKYPQIFTLNQNRTVVLTEGNSFTLPYAAESATSERGIDEVDSHDKREYISDSDSNSDEERPSDMHHNILTQANSTERPDAESVSSSISDSSVDVFSSDIVQTSDSDSNSLSSNSTV